MKFAIDVLEALADGPATCHELCVAMGDTSRPYKARVMATLADLAETGLVYRNGYANRTYDHFPGKPRTVREIVWQSSE